MLLDRTEAMAGGGVGWLVHTAMFMAGLAAILHWWMIPMVEIEDARVREQRDG
jgi:hypothetical protein